MSEGIDNTWNVEQRKLFAKNFFVSLVYPHKPQLKLDKYILNSGKDKETLIIMIICRLTSLIWVSLTRQEMCVLIPCIRPTIYLTERLSTSTSDSDKFHLTE